MKSYSQELWEAAKARQKALDTSLKGLHRNNRPNYRYQACLNAGLAEVDILRSILSDMAARKAETKGQAFAQIRRP